MIYPYDFINKIIHGDCLEVMKDIPDKSIDMVLCDLPYGSTACKWDVIIPFEPLWDLYKRIIKSNGAIVLTASQPFTSLLVMSNLKWFKYEWIWKKSRATGHIHSKNKPLKNHENILVFSSGTTIHKGQSENRMEYNPQGIIEVNIESYRPSRGVGDYAIVGVRPSHKKTVLQTHKNYPKSTIEISSEHNVGQLHPTQKPVALFEYLIKTYTNENDLVLDNCSGSGTTAIACINTNRKYICIEKDEDYYNKSIERVNQVLT